MFVSLRNSDRKNRRTILFLAIIRNLFHIADSFRLYMWDKIVVLLVITGVFLLSSGCSDIFGPSGSGESGSGAATTPTPAPTPRYGIGDIVMKSPDDRIGVVIQNFDPAGKTYSTRSVILGDFGEVSFYAGGGSKSFSFQDFETQYPYKRGTVDNPYNLPSPTRDYTPKYGINQIVTQKNIPHEGIKILSYDYPRDAYTYIYVYKQGSAWVARDNITYTGARTDVEERYAEKNT